MIGPSSRSQFARHVRRSVKCGGSLSSINRTWRVVPSSRGACSKHLTFLLSLNVEMKIKILRGHAVTRSNIELGSSRQAMRPSISKIGVRKGDHRNLRQHGHHSPKLLGSGSRKNEKTVFLEDVSALPDPVELARYSRMKGNAKNAVKRYRHALSGKTSCHAT